MKFIKSLKFLFMPRWWLMNHPYSEALDLRMNEAMDRGQRVTNLSKHECDFDGMRVWIASHPYASCQFNKSRPSRLTIERFFNYINYHYGRIY
jgi:hypothetical protein